MNINRLTQLYQNPKHLKAENTPYILRLRFKDPLSLPSKIDCILLAAQYIALYEAMEERLKSFKDLNISYLTLFLNLNEALERSNALKADVNEMLSHLSSKESAILTKNLKIAPQTRNMITDIENADALRLFAWYSVRYLGDVYGGQALNGYTQRTFSDTPLKGDFYKDISYYQKDIATHVKEAVLTEEDNELFLRAVDDVFQYHIELFQYMEFAGIVNIKSQSLFQNRYVIFGASALLAGAAYFTHQYLSEPRA